MSGLQRTVERFHDWEPLPIEGEIPTALRGTLIRTGPGVFERFGRRLSHSFEADGALMALRLDGDGEAHGAVRIVESPGYREEQAAGRPLFGTAAPRWRRIANGLTGRVKTTGNTNVMRWQGQTYALMEGGRPVEIDAATLGTREVADFGGVLGAAFSAHPHRVASLRSAFNFGQVWGPKPALDLYALPDEGPARKLGRVPIPWNTMVHDFAVTERHAVFVICPAKLRLGKALLGSPDFDQYFAWDPQAGAELIIVSLSDPTQVSRHAIDGRWVFHLSNAFERGSDLVVDWVQYPDFEVFSALSGDGGLADFAGPHVRRLTVDLQRSRLRSDEVLWERACDFPVLPGGRFGHEYSTCWYAKEGEGFAGGIARLDVETGEADVWDAGPGHSASEAVFVRRPGATRDDDGWLLSLVYDGWKTRSYFAVFDADRPSAGPLAKMWLDQPLPLSFHGTFVPRA
ncbi:MAG: carotenoid oxygenase family protein [Myxococcota bacterium]